MNVKTIAHPSGAVRLYARPRQHAGKPHLVSFARGLVLNEIPKHVGTVYQVAVLSALARQMTADGLHTYRAVNDLRTDTKLSRSKVISTLGELKRAGLLVELPVQPLRQAPTRYRLGDMLLRCLAVATDTDATAASRGVHAVDGGVRIVDGGVRITDPIRESNQRRTREGGEGADAPDASGVPARSRMAKNGNDLGTTNQVPVHQPSSSTTGAEQTTQTSSVKSKPAAKADDADRCIALFRKRWEHRYGRTYFVSDFEARDVRSLLGKGATIDEFRTATESFLVDPNPFYAKQAHTLSLLVRNFNALTASPVEEESEWAYHDRKYRERMGLPPLTPTRKVVSGGESEDAREAAAFAKFAKRGRYVPMLPNGRRDDVMSEAETSRMLRGLDA